MPGAAHRYHPTKPLPWLSGVLFILALVDFAIDWVMTLTIDRWAKQVPSANHWYEYHMMGSRTYYLTPAVGWYLDNDLWIFLAMLALAFVISPLYGVRWERVR